jgi:hypothetical protein
MKYFNFVFNLFKGRNKISFSPLLVKNISHWWGTSQQSQHTQHRLTDASLLTQHFHIKATRCHK